NVFSIACPPLRERGDDLGLLVDYYVRRFGRELERPVHHVPGETSAALARYPWPGNVRELPSALKQALLHMRGSGLLPECRPAGILGGQAGPEPGPGGLDWDGFIRQRLEAGSQDLYAESLGLMERQLITRVLQHTGGNQVQAARILGITRGSLRTKIRALRITIERSVCSDDDQPE